MSLILGFHKPNYFKDNLMSRLILTVAELKKFINETKDGDEAPQNGIVSLEQEVCDYYDCKKEDLKPDWKNIWLDARRRRVYPQKAKIINDRRIKN